MMDVIFLGYCVSKEIAENLSGISIAGNKMQLNLLTYMREYVRNLDVITIYPVASFPTDRKLIYKSEKIQLNNDLYARRIPFLNIPLVKQFNQIFGNYKVMTKLVERYPDAVILTFNMYPQIGVPAVWIKKKYGNQIVTLLADLPIDDNYNRCRIGKWIYQIYNALTVRLLRQVDKVIVLNREAWKIYTSQAECLVMEGGFDEKEYNVDINKKNIRIRKNIVYGGSLNDYSGIRELIEAMKYVENIDIELDIYGEGHMKEYVRRKCGNRIHYYGSISNKKMMEVQQSAWALINPRSAEDAIAKVTFPSKIFEYLMSGTPVISTRLNGFSMEYEDLLMFTEDNSPGEIARCINEMAKRPYEEMLNMAGKAREYIIKNKSWRVQTERIIDFMEKEIE